MNSIRRSKISEISNSQGCPLGGTPVKQPLRTDAKSKGHQRDTMSRISIRFAVSISLLLLLAGPGMAMHLGPPSDNNGDGTGDPTWRAGCTCHASSPNTGTLVKLAGAPHAYETGQSYTCLLYTSPSPRDQRGSRMPSSA